MATRPTLDQLGQLGLPGMSQAFAELESFGDAATLSHADWLGPSLGCELTHLQRVPKLFTELALARGDDRYAASCAALPASSS